MSRSGGTSLFSEPECCRRRLCGQGVFRCQQQDEEPRTFGAMRGGAGRPRRLTWPRRVAPRPRFTWDGQRDFTSLVGKTTKSHGEEPEAREEESPTDATAAEEADSDDSGGGDGATARSARTAARSPRSALCTRDRVRSSCSPNGTLAVTPPRRRARRGRRGAAARPGVVMGAGVPFRSRFARLLDTPPFSLHI